MELFAQWVVPALVGVGIGILSGLLGVGGGTIMVPVFRLAFGMSPIMSTATSLFTIVPTSISGAISHVRNKTCLPALGLAAGLGGALTSPLGVQLASISPAWLIMMVAALIIAWSAVNILGKAIKAKPKPAPASGTALRGHRLLIFEYDNGGYMNTGYQLSYSTPKGARSSTSHVGAKQYGKTFFHKDMPRIMAATGIPYVATAAESDPVDFIKKAAKAAFYARTEGTAYLKALSACPLNWNDAPATERKVIEAGVNCCFFPLYEIEQGAVRLSYAPDETGKKIPVADWLAMMGRTKHLCGEAYKEVADSLQREVDRRYERLKAESGKR